MYLNSIFSKLPVLILNLWLWIYWGSTRRFRPYHQYQRTISFWMVYKYVFIAGVNSNLIIIISSLRLCNITPKWDYCTSPYTCGLLSLYQYIRVIKTSQLIQVKIMSGYRVTQGDCTLNPYPDSQWGGLFGHKDIHTTLRPPHQLWIHSQSGGPIKYPSTLTTFLPW